MLGQGSKDNEHFGPQSLLIVIYTLCHHVNATLNWEFEHGTQIH